MRRQCSIPVPEQPACDAAVGLLLEMLRDALPELEVDRRQAGLIRIGWDEPGAEDEEDELEEEKEVQAPPRSSGLTHYLPTLLALGSNAKAAEAFSSLAAPVNGSGSAGHPVARDKED